MAVSRWADGDRLRGIVAAGKGHPQRQGFHVELAPLDGSALFDFEVRYPEWGIHPLPELGVRASDWLGAVRAAGRSSGRPSQVRVLPTEERIRRLFVPDRVGAGLGDLVSAGRGDGLEFAELRPFRIGDDLRRVNHRASACRGLWVGDRHPERNADVILLADLLFDRGPGNRAVVDRVVEGGVLGLRPYRPPRSSRSGGARRDVRWVAPRMGSIQRYGVLDALLETQLLQGWAGPMAGCW